MTDELNKTEYKQPVSVFDDSEAIKALISQKLQEEYASIFLVDLEKDIYRFVYRNQESGFADVPGGSYSEVIGEYISRVDPEYQSEWLKMSTPGKVREYLAREDRREYVYRLSGIDKGWRRSVSLVLERRDGVVTKFIMTYITLDSYAAENTMLMAKISAQAQELAEKQAELEEALSRAHAASEAKTAFLFNMSHDIRTPMNAITGYTVMARNHIDDRERVDDYLKKIGIAGENLLELINKVLDMSRIESGRVIIDEAPYDIRERVDAMLMIVSPSASLRNIKLEGDSTSVRDSKVLGDSGRLSQIFINVLGNAIKYTPSGGSVSFKVEQTESPLPEYCRYVFTVTDTGIGMDSEYLKKIYEPFSREKSATESRIEGTGLGMSIVKKLVDLMGGTINIQSEPEKGTRVKITLDMLPKDDNSECFINYLENHRKDFEGKRLLLVEDNEMNREIASVILEEQGFIVETAEDGMVAVEMVQSIIDNNRPDYYSAILMDIQMPRMDGFEATRAIRSIYAPGVRIPIIAMTANAFDDDRRRCFEVGMDDHLAKPIDIAIMLATLVKYV